MKNKIRFKYFKFVFEVKLVLSVVERSE